MKVFRRITILLFAISSAFISGCKKSQTLNDPGANSQPNNSEVAAAKTYFDKEIQKTPQSGSIGLNSTISNFNAIRDLLKSVDWANAKIQTFQGTSFVVVPIKFDSTILIHPSYLSPGIRIGLNSLSKLILYKDKSGHPQYEIETGFPDERSLEFPDSSFSGTILVQNWAGDILGSYQYTNGKVYNLSLDTTGSGNTGVNQTAENVLAVTTCYWVEWYTCVATSDSESCTLTSIQNQGCTTSYIDDGGGSTTTTTSVTSTTRGYLTKPPPPGTTKGFIIPIDQATMCGKNYKWTLIGNARYAQFDGSLNVDVRGWGEYLGEVINYSLNGATFMFGIGVCATDAQASDALNKCFNYAIQQEMLDYNRGVGVGGFFTINFAKYVRNYMNIYYGGQAGAATFSFSGLGPSFPLNSPSWCYPAP